MAERKVTIIECDRCHDVVDPDIFKAEGGQVMVPGKGKHKVRVWDLCPSCRVLHERFLEMKSVDN